jgi:hypothetical protein
MTCRQWENWLDDRLEGQATPAWEQHAAHCPECAARLRDADRLLLALKQQAPLPVPVSLQARLMQSVLLDQQQRARPRLLGRARVGSAALLAALLLLAVASYLLWYRSSEGPRVVQGPRLDQEPRVVLDPPVEPPLLPPESELPWRHNMQRAGQVMASLTVRTAGEAVESTSSLWPMSGVEWPSVQLPPTPPVEPLRSAGQRLSAGLEPVTDSARRAMNRFWRDLPLGRRTPVE